MGRMRQMLNGEAMAAARMLSRREHSTLGEAVSRLARNGDQKSGTERLPVTGEFSMLGQRPGKQITSEDVYALLDED